MHIVVYGNCQVASIAAALRFHRPGDTVNSINKARENAEKRPIQLRKLIKNADILITQARDSSRTIGPDELPLPENALHLRFPAIVFTGFHPDQSYIRRSDNSCLGPISHYSSKLTIYGLLRGLTPEQTLKLFRPDVYDALGFDFEEDLSNFISHTQRWGLDPSPFVASWIDHGCFMHTVNHPRLRVVSDLVAAALKQAGLETNQGNCADYLPDPLSKSIWPVIPGLKSPLKATATSSVFLLALSADRARKPEFLTLASYIERVHATLVGLRETDLHPKSVDTFGKMDSNLEPVVRDLRRGGKPGKSERRSNNPYKNLPDHHFWRKSISALEPKSINPMINAPFKVTQTDRIATAGSCFAQHIAQRLAQSGYNYYVAEQPPDGMIEVEAKAKSYGVYSARYANVYTARQLLQLFQRAFGAYSPADTCWPSLNRGFIDPFRPEIEPESDLSAEEVIESARVHLAAVREMFLNLDVFVFTLGLTEAWRNKKDDAVYPLAPGVVSSAAGEDVEFVNFSFDEVRADLFAFIAALRGVNPAARVILTVSPVPLIATYENRHVLTSTVASKSILRAAADEASRKLEKVMYFPSFEIITMAAARGGYFEADLRSVKTVGVDHVMRCFFESCTSNTGPVRKTKTSGQSNAALSELQELAEIICDEEQIVAGL